MTSHVILLLVPVAPFAVGRVGAADKPAGAPAFHGEAAKPRGGLDLRLRRLVLEGGDSGPAVVAGKPGDSLLLERVQKGEMPPGKRKLSAAQVETLRRWV